MSIWVHGAIVSSAIQLNQQRNHSQTHKVLLEIFVSKCTQTKKFVEISLKHVQAVGFEPTPPERPRPERGALDHSATLACKPGEDNTINS